MCSFWSRKSIASIISIALGLGVVAFALQRMATRAVLAQNEVASPAERFHSRQAQPVANDGPNPDSAPTIQFSSIGYSVNEGDGFVTVTINRSGDASQQSTLIMPPATAPARRIATSSTA